MTATATRGQASEQALIHDKEWVRLFPEQVTENFTSSLTFMKQLTVVAVSTITYLKNAFPEDCYDSEVFGGLRLKMLKSRCGDELAQFVSTAVQQAFDAFDKKYVEKLALCFYDGECSPENLLEYHVFEYTYSADGGELSVNSKNRNNARQSVKCSMQSVKARTNMILRSLSLFVWQNCDQELPVNYDVSLRLYYNQDTPDDYQAPGFQGTDVADHLEAIAPEACCLGWVDTPYHKLVARSFVRGLRDSDVAEASDNQPEMSLPDNEDLRESVSSPAPAPRCPCGKRDADQPLLTCQYCQMQQHQACFGFLAPVQDHCCERCADEDSSRKPSDQVLVGLEKRKRECVCIFRRALELCCRAAAVSGLALMSRLRLSAASAAKVLRLLQSHHVLAGEPHDADLAAPRKINHLRLKLTLKRFFNVEQPDDAVERLAADTARVSVDPQPAVGPPPPSPPAPDATLQQYRAAVHLAHDDGEEPPLSGDHNPVKDVRNIGNKRKKDDDEDWLPAKLPRTRAGASTKRRA